MKSKILALKEPYRAQIHKGWSSEVVCGLSGTASTCSAMRSILEMLLVPLYLTREVGRRTTHQKRFQFTVLGEFILKSTNESFWVLQPHILMFSCAAAWIWYLSISASWKILTCPSYKGLEIVSASRNPKFSRKGPCLPHGHALKKKEVSPCQVARLVGASSITLGVEGSNPSRGTYGRQLINVSLSLSLPPHFLSLKSIILR